MVMLAADAIKTVAWHRTDYISPHEYMVFHENPKAYRVILAKIKAEGVMAKFRGQSYRYWFFEGYKYWCIQNVINRAKV